MKAYVYLLVTAIVVNTFNVALGMTSSYVFDKFVGEDKRQPVWKRRAVNFSFGVLFTLVVGEVGVARMQKSVVERSKMII